MAKAIHSMIRVFDLENSIKYYDAVLGLKVQDRYDFDGFTLVYLRNEEADFELELTWNDGREEPYTHGDGYGHLAVCVEDVHFERSRIIEAGFETGDVKEFFREGSLMARFFFVEDPDGYKIEFLEHHGRFK